MIIHNIAVNRIQFTSSLIRFLFTHYSLAWPSRQSVIAKASDAYWPPTQYTHYHSHKAVCCDGEITLHTILESIYSLLSVSTKYLFNLTERKLSFILFSTLSFLLFFFALVLFIFVRSSLYVCFFLSTGLHTYIPFYTSFDHYKDVIEI